jgi:hypothetical protein
LGDFGWSSLGGRLRQLVASENNVDKLVFTEAQRRDGIAV